MSTTIESLELEIKQTSQSAVDGINALTQSLTNLRNATKGGLGLTSVTKQLSALNTATNSINAGAINNLSGLAKAVQLLSGVKISSTLGKNITSMFTAIDTLDINKFTDKIKEMSSVLEPLANQMGKISSGFSVFSKGANKVTSTVNKMTNANNKSVSSFIGLSGQTLISAYAIKKAFSFVYGFIEKASDYIEDLNLFTVAMGQYADEASSYAQQVSELMGIDPGEWMRNQGLFQTLITGFGVAGDGASKMSKNLTQLAYDLSSFYNIDVEQAMQKLKSGMAGELEPLRAIGYDLSQAKLEATAKELGIDKVVSEMTQAEKSMLRYHAIMSQVTVTHGDMARTLDQPANQIRILKAQLEMLGREIGNVFMPLLQAILPYLIATVKVLREIISAIAVFVGFKTPEIELPETDGMVSGSEDTEDALAGASEQAKKLKSYMLGFDELNVINPNTESSDSSTSDVFDIPILEYDFISESVSSKVNEIVDKLKEWLGITGEIDSWSKLFDTRLGDILTTVTLIAGQLLLWKLANSFKNSIATITGLLSNPTYAIAIGIMLTITGIKITLDGLKDAIKNGLDGFNFAEIVGGSLLTIAGASLLGKQIVTWIGQVASTKVVFALARLGTKLGVSTTGALGVALGLGISAIIAGIPMYFVGIYDAITKEIDGLSATLIGIGATLTGAGIGFLIGGPIGAGIGALIGLAVGLVTDLVILIVQKWDEISAWFGKVAEWFNTNVIQPIAGFFVSLWEDIKVVWNTVATWFDTNIIQPVVKFFKGLWESISGFFTSLWEDIKEVWNKVSTWFDEKVVQPIVKFFAPIVEWISQFFYGCWLIIQAVWVVASTWFNEFVIIPIVEFFRGLWGDVSTFFTNLWNDIVLIWNTVATWFNDFVITPIVNFFKGVWTAVSEFFKSLWKDIKDIWDKVSTWFNEFVIIPVVDFFKGVWTSVSGFFSSLWEDVKGVWEKVSKWFDDEIITPVKTAFEKACEAIGKFFTSLWLGIRQGVANAMNGVIGGIESAINGVIKGINGLIGGFDKVVQWAADILGKDWGGISIVQEVKFNRITVPTFAQGGFPESGQTFIARENGIPEMVGTIGRRTAVANNEQIVESVASGVAEANGEQNMLLREQNSLLRALLEKDTGVYLDGRSLSKSVDKFKNEQGRVILGGAL